jgi:hypothetical protein
VRNERRFSGALNKGIYALSSIENRQVWPNIAADVPAGNARPLCGHPYRQTSDKKMPGDPGIFSRVDYKL